MSVAAVVVATVAIGDTTGNGLLSTQTGIMDGRNNVLHGGLIDTHTHTHTHKKKKQIQADKMW
eukprot:scaffold5922_cov160-Amphora_coffeaeformis.AAC.3